MSKSKQKHHYPYNHRKKYFCLCNVHIRRKKHHYIRNFIFISIIFLILAVIPFLTYYNDDGLMALWLYLCFSIGIVIAHYQKDGLKLLKYIKEHDVTDKKNSILEAQDLFFNTLIIILGMLYMCWNSINFYNKADLSSRITVLEIIKESILTFVIFTTTKWPKL